MEETDHVFELPFDPACVVPLICAWRACDARLPEQERAARALEQLRQWGSAAFFDDAPSVARAVEFLRDARIDLDTPLSPPRGGSLCPPETACVVCGCRNLRLVPRAGVVAW